MIRISSRNDRPLERTPLSYQPDQREQLRAKFAQYAATRDQSLREELVEAHLGLAEYLARRFANRGESLDDLVQVASYGLLKAVDRFDPDRGVEFSTYATHTIVGEIKRHFRDRAWAIRAPRRMQELYLRLGKVVGTLGQELGRSPTIAELANDLAVSEEEVLEALEAGAAYRFSSLDAPNAADDDTQSLAARLGEEDARFTDADDRATLYPLLVQLPPREQRLIQLRFFEGLTQSEIAARLGISQMHVSRLLARSVAQLRAAANAGSLGDPLRDGPAPKDRRRGRAGGQPRPEGAQRPRPEGAQRTSPEGAQRTSPEGAQRTSPEGAQGSSRPGGTVGDRTAKP